MHFSLVVLALLALSGATLADEECKTACKNQCALGLTLCGLTPADELCAEANKVCTSGCDSACGCLDTCLSSCPSPQYGKGLTALTGNVVGFGSTAVCRTTCKSSCGVKLVASSTKDSFSLVLKVAKMLFGMATAAQPAQATTS